MEIPVTQLPPGDPRLVDAIVGQLKSKGIFDQFRKVCLADVDTKPAFQNLRQRVEGQVNKFLEKKKWKNDLNKNQLRDGVRKHVNSLGILDSGIDAIITQVVNPKIKPLILPFVEDTVYAFLQIDKPKRGRKDSELEVSPLLLREREYDEKEDVEKTPNLNDYQELPKQRLLPMETDVISSEEDDILARESPDGDKKSVSSSESDVAIDENARDGFENSPQLLDVNTPEDIASNVERLNLSEDESKSAQAAKPSLPLFDDQSLDSISSNTSGLTFSPLTDKESPDSKKSPGNTPKSDDNSKADGRSATSTPLVDEKPIDESSQSSLESDISKTFQSSDKGQGEQGGMTPSLSVITSSARSVKDGASGMSVDEEDSHESKESSKISQASIAKKLEIEEKPKSDKSEGEITSSSSEMSDTDGKSKPESSHSDEKNHSDHDSSHKSSRSRGDHSRRDSYSRERDREREKDRDRHHKDRERKHSKSRDDHHSHRDKDKKYHRRDKDHDGEKDRSRSHHHQSSSSHKESSGSGRSSGDRDKDRSSHHSGGKTSEGRSRSKQSGEKSEGKQKSEDKSEGISHKRDESKHDRRHHGSLDRKSDSRSEGKRDKKSEERSGKKSEQLAEKKENLDGKPGKPGEGKSDSKNKKKSEDPHSKYEGRSHKSGKDSSSSSSSRHKRSGSSSKEDDKKRHKHIHRSKEDKEKKENQDKEIKSTENNNTIVDSIDIHGGVQNGESTIDTEMLGFSTDNIIVADDEGNLMLLTYDTDTDSASAVSPAIPVDEDSLCSEVLSDEEDDFQGFVQNDFEGFENSKTDRRLIDYLRASKNIPDEMDKESSGLFNDSDFHIRLDEQALDGMIPLEDFLKIMQQLGAVIKEDKGEIEDPTATAVGGAEPNERNVPVTRSVGKRRRISNSSSVSSNCSSTGSPKHKRLRRGSPASSNTSQTLEQDSLIVSGYAVLTPEDDGNRSMSREFDMDYSQKIPNYSPLSPASDSSADEGKLKGSGVAVKPPPGIAKPTTRISQKADPSWSKEKSKFPV